jgi:predicted dehydrogenase
MDRSRRIFVKNSLIAGAAAYSAPLIKSQSRGRYRTALIGSGWWGMNILRYAMASGECNVTGLCDVDQNHLKGAEQEVHKLTGSKPALFRDYRELLHKTKPEIVIVATPDHWHALAGIAAIESGAHVYLEKPIGHTIKEGQALVKASRKHNRVVQVGTHRRMSPHNKSAMEFLRSGKVGKISMVRAFVHGNQSVREKVPDSEPPEGLDWDMWCGPAPLRPFNKSIHPKGFRQYLDYANGQIGDWGIHWFDQLLWWSEEKYPQKIFSTGGKFIRTDNPDAPDTQLATFEFESFTVSWEHRMFGANNSERTNIGIYFNGTEGVLHVGWQDGWTFYPANKNRQVLHEDARLNQPDNQNIKELFADFLQSIQRGIRPFCDIEAGHRATNMSLLAMISYRVGRSIQWDGQKEVIIADREASSLMSRPYRKPWTYPKV